MNDVEAAVRALGRAIQKDPRYTAYQQAKTANDGDEALQRDIQEFNLKRMAYQRETERSAEAQDASKLKEMEEEVQVIYERVLTNPHMQAFGEAKQAMDGMMQEIDQILTLCANGEDPDTCHPDLSGCTGDCTSCGGCH